MTSSLPILIAGGGIGGLALALALAKSGQKSAVLERQPEFATAGAGIQIGPNGVRALQELGVADAVKPFAGKPEAIVVHGGSNGRVLAQLPLGAWICERHGAPYWVAHRGDLHRLLAEAAALSSDIALHTSCEVTTITQCETGVLVTDANGRSLEGGALIGADGLWSLVRKSVAPAAEPAFAGATATRTVIPVADAGRLAMPAVGLWLSPTAHVVHYPVRGGTEIAVVVIAREPWRGREWDAQADAAELQGRIGHFHASLTDVLARAQRWRRWALHGLAPLPTWVQARVALMGDAAHPMLPYLAQGGALALEDAIVLARCLTGCPRDVPAALSRYQRLRHARATRVQRASLMQGRIYRLGLPLAWARDGVLRAAPGRALMARFDWLYGWRPPPAAEDLRPRG
jgi:salicylate hydroxylase